MPTLDGTETIKPTPFDVHEQAVRVPHTYDPKEGYKADPDFEPSEFPKAIDHVQKEGAPAGHFEPVIANSPEEE